MITDRDSVPGDFKFAWCSKCGRLTTYVLVKSKRTGAYIAKHFCGACEDFVTPIWEKDKPI